MLYPFMRTIVHPSPSVLSAYLIMSWNGARKKLPELWTLKFYILIHLIWQLKGPSSMAIASALCGWQLSNCIKSDFCDFGINPALAEEVLKAFSREGSFHGWQYQLASGLTCITLLWFYKNEYAQIWASYQDW